MPQVMSGDDGDSGANSGALAIIEPIKNSLPDMIDVAALKYKHIKDDSPLTVVLLQEVTRYNILLRLMAKSLTELEKGIQGLVVISPALEEMMISLLQNQVPRAWSSTYFSMKPLANWNNDLKQRYEFFQLWAQKGQPFVYTVSYFTYQPVSPPHSCRGTRERLVCPQSIDLSSISFLLRRLSRTFLKLLRMVPSSLVSSWKVPSGTWRRCVSRSLKLWS
jgi:hypothetical protein